MQVGTVLRTNFMGTSFSPVPGVEAVRPFEGRNPDLFLEGEGRQSSTDSTGIRLSSETQAFLDELASAEQGLAGQGNSFAALSDAASAVNYTSRAGQVMASQASTGQTNFSAHTHSQGQGFSRAANVYNQSMASSRGMLQPSGTAISVRV